MITATSGVQLTSSNLHRKTLHLTKTHKMFLFFHLFRPSTNRLSISTIFIAVYFKKQTHLI
jgi:hypothetical protein